LIVGGPNGSGKTTSALEYSAQYGLPYVGADAIAATLNPTNPASANIEAARQFSNTLEQFINEKTSFVCESTLSGLTMQGWIKSAKDAGFLVEIVFVFLDSAEMCIARVAERVRKGGHHVPEADVRRRFGRSLNNFWRIYRPLADGWVILHNGLLSSENVAIGSQEGISIHNPKLFSVCSNYGGELNQSKIAAESYARFDDLIRLSNIAVARAQEESRRLGVPNVYCINGRIYYETPTGELSLTDPYVEKKGESGTKDV